MEGRKIGPRGWQRALATQALYKEHAAHAQSHTLPPMLAALLPLLVVALCLAASFSAADGPVRIRVESISIKTKRVTLVLGSPIFDVTSSASGNGKEETFTYMVTLDRGLYHPDAAIVTGNGLRHALSKRSTFFWTPPPYWAGVTIHGDDDFFILRGVFMLPSNGTLIAVLPIMQARPASHHKNSFVEHYATSTANMKGKTDIIGDLPRHLKDLHLDHEQLQSHDRQRSLTYNATATGPIQFTPSCYPGDSYAHTLQVSIAVDLTYQAQMGSYDSLAVTDEVEAAVGVARVAYMAQLNVGLQIVQIYVATEQQDNNTVMGAPTCYGVVDAITDFSAWKANVAEPSGLMNKTGASVMFSGCDTSSGIVGIANVGGICQSVVNTAVIARAGAGGALGDWLTFAHELGHVVGALHTFQNGVGTTGGIMDYSDGTYLGVIQFHPYARSDLCNGLSWVVNAQCPYLFLTPEDASCGDGLLEPGETCECLELGNQTCGACVGCQLTSGYAECSLADFVVRNNAMMSAIVEVSASLLADVGCCDPRTKLLAGPRSTCTSWDPLFNQWETGNVCSWGKCVSMCYIDESTPCGFDASGCNMACQSSAYHISCSFNLGSANVVPDNTACVLPNGAGTGICRSGTCSAAASLSGDGSFTFAPTPPTLTPSGSPLVRSKPTLPPTAKPTGKPVSSKTPTIWPSHRPTSLPTQRPNAAATTLSPLTSSSPSSSLPTTQSPASVRPTTITPTTKSTSAPTSKPTTTLPPTLSSRVPSKAPTMPTIPTSSPRTRAPTTLFTTNVGASATAPPSSGAASGLWGLLAVPLLIVGFAGVVSLHRRRQWKKRAHPPGFVDALSSHAANNPSYGVGGGQMVPLDI